MLFHDIPGVWGSLQSYAVFNTAAKTGMRCGEVLALTWNQIDFVKSEIDVSRAWKGADEIGLPKWNRKRRIPVVASVLDVLEQLREDSVRTGGDDLVFCYEHDGSRLGETWWRKTFNRVVQESNLGDGVTGHSLRHSLHPWLMRCFPVNAALRTIEDY